MRFIALTLALLFAGCSPPVKLSREAALVRSKCGACHPRPGPDDETAAAWKKVKGWHQEKLGLSNEEGDQIHDHLRGLISPKVSGINR